MNTTSKVPTPKMTSVGVSGSIMLIIIWLAGLGGIDVPPEVASAVTVLVAWLSGYLTSDSVGRVARWMGWLAARFQQGKNESDDAPGD